MKKYPANPDREADPEYPALDFCNKAAERLRGFPGAEKVDG